MDKRQKLALIIDVIALVILWRMVYADRPMGPAFWHHTARTCRQGAFVLGWCAIEAEKRYFQAVAQ